MITNIEGITFHPLGSQHKHLHGLGRSKYSKKRFASGVPLKLDSLFKMFSLVLCLISCSCFSVARGELQAVCSSGMTVSKNQTASPGVVKLTGTLSHDRKLQRSCVLKMDTPESCLHVKAKKNGNSQGMSS